MVRDVILETSETDSSEFTISYWKVDVGDSVREGDELVVVESVDDKTALAVASPFSGRLVEILAREEESVSQGDRLGRIEGD